MGPPFFKFSKLYLNYVGSVDPDNWWEGLCRRVLGIKNSLSFKKVNHATINKTRAKTDNISSQELYRLWFADCVLSLFS